MTQGGILINNFFSYKRISTKEERGLQKYNRQEAALKKYAEDHGIEYVAEFQEDESGKSFDNRKEWNRLEKLIQPGDTVIFNIIRNGVEMNISVTIEKNCLTQY